MKLISGMHRSGTSLVAKVFHEAGADMGNPETFYRPDRWNPDGYFEQTDVHAANMPLINGPFWKLAYFFLPSEATLLRRGRRRSRQLRALASKYRGKVVKENRFCLTLPAWIEHGAQVERLLVVLREPEAVARSLQRRNHVTAARAYSLWLEHNRRLLEAAERHGIARRFILYGNLLDPRRQHPEAEAALRFFGLAPSAGEVEAILRSTVKPTLDHGPARSGAHYPPEVESLWRHLQGEHARQREERVPVLTTAGTAG